MPKLNRRRFLQVASAAGFAPALPAFPSSGAATAKGLSTAQQLWVSMYSRAQSTSTVPALVKSMGISPQAAQGVFTRLVQVQALAAHQAVRFANSTAQPVATTSPAAKVPTPSASIDVDVKKMVTDRLDIRDALDLEDTAAEEVPAALSTEES